MTQDVDDETRADTTEWSAPGVVAAVPTYAYCPTVLLS
jgi:hypothetical protein